MNFFFLIPQKNKKGWIKIVEAFIAIMLITVVILLILENRTISGLGENQNPENQITQTQISILRNIQMNNSLRNEIVGISKSELPVTEEEMPLIKNKVEKEKPFYFNCTFEICSVSGECLLNNSIDKDIFVSEIGIFSNLTHYSPKKLKLFCWENEI